MSNYATHSRIYNIKADSLDPTTTKFVPAKQHSILNNKPAKTQNDHSSLSGLLAHYNSDSEYEDTNGHESNKLDAKVDDFLQEINQLSCCSEVKSIEKTKPSASAWQACVDEFTGYPYYWNIETNVVTWDVPNEYEEYLKTLSQVDLIKETHEKPQNILPKYVPKSPEKQVIPKVPEKTLVVENVSETRKVTLKKIKMPPSDSEDEKIVMITSFSEDSSSESETEKIINLKTDSLSKEQEVMEMGPHIEDIPKENRGTGAILVDSNKKEIIEPAKDENIDETIILSRLRTHAKVLQELGGELPVSVDKSIDNVELSSDKIQSLSLVAGYGDDSDVEEEPIRSGSIFPISIEMQQEESSPTESQSTLFPVTKPIDVKQFDLPVKTVILLPKEQHPIQVVASDLQSKIFKRKKRLGIAFDVKPTVMKEKRGKFEFSEGEDKKGFGFLLQEKEREEKVTNNNKKASIRFIKADTLLNVDILPIDLRINEESLEDFDAIKEVVHEKVTFLGEGKPVVSAVQMMAIQLQTLEAAFAAGGLSRNYLYSWLRETFTELGKLEQDAAPDGWHCQWDRLNKRYFYRHQLSGETQWTYPDADIVGGGEAMDICTTPPPIEDLPPVLPHPPTESPQSEPVAPSPPKIRAKSPTPPPPPIITSVGKTSPITSTDEVQPPLPLHVEVAIIPPPPPTVSESDNQPLPPGVDSPDYLYLPIKEEVVSEKLTPRDYSLGSELDSFYSEIAAIEPTSINEATKILDINNVPSPSSIVLDSVASTEPIVKKKKKNKQKLGQGINMKKKAVSTLVEKWKKVQNDYL